MRSELDKLHSRVSDLKERVVNLEAQGPHINAALGRIEKSVDKLNGHLVKAVWAVLTPTVVAIVAFIVAGGLKLH